MGVTNLWSMNTMQTLHKLQTANGLEMGRFCRTRASIKNIIAVIGKMLKDGLVNSIKEATGAIGLILDGSDDSGRKHKVAILVCNY